MTKKNKAALFFLYTLSFLLGIFALIYLLYPTILPYHEEYLGFKHHELDERTALFILFAMRIIGGCLLGLGFVLTVLIKHLYTGQLWIRSTILIMMMLVLSIMEYVMLSIGLFTPWWLVIVAMICVIAGYILSKPSGTE